MNLANQSSPIDLGKRGKVVAKREHSRRWFQKALGVAPREVQSGDSKKLKKSGSQLCRTSLWQWVMMVLEVKSRRHLLKSKIAQHLAICLDNQKQKTKAVWHFCWHRAALGAYPTYGFFMNLMREK